jgi:inner membrane protein
MDPITQGALGAALPAATGGARQTRVAAAVGFVAGTAADLDVLIRSQTDSLLFLEYHRQFTHSFAFIPVGGFLAAALFFICFRRWLSIGFSRLWLFSSLGYATHGLLDAATSYGTQLFWPFSDNRISFSIVSVVDPLFTLPVLGLAVIAILRKKPGWARLAMVWAVCYLAVGAYRHQAARALAEELAQQRGHAAVRLDVKPTFANLVVWRSVYEADGRFYVDGVRPGFAAAIVEGASIAKLDLARSLPWLDPGSQQARDIERFSRFSDGFVAAAGDDDERIIDVRYAFLPNEIAPLWSILLDRTAPPAAHVRFETHRGDAGRNLRALMAMAVNWR